jgi:hypothetical protein
MSKKATEYCKQLTINKQQQNKQNSKISEKYLTSVKKTKLVKIIK